MQELNAKRGELADRLVEADTQVSDLENDQKRAEADLEPVRARRLRDQERIDNGTVTDPKALASMVSEVEHLTRRISDLEDAELEVMEALESAQAARDVLRRDQGAIETQMRELIASRDAEVSKIDAEAAELKTERQALVAALPGALVTFYDQVRQQHGGSGAAALQRRRCTGCQLDANAADLRAYAAAPPDAVLRCEECGRILVRTADSGL